VRGYNQFCPAARALDLVGDRWTLLIVRELLLGPKRYTDLQEGLPGIGPTLLAARLRSLEDAALIGRRRLPAPAASNVYELTDLGRGLRPVLSELFRWGMHALAAPRPGDAVRASWLLAAIEARAERQPVRARVDESYELRIGDEVITVAVRRGTVDARQGPAEAPALIVETDPETFAALGMGRLSPQEAIREQRLAIDGDPNAARRCSELFGLLEAEPEPVSG
jgi:DNA-binding HxlR family transcriptional regulator